MFLPRTVNKINTCSAADQVVRPSTADSVFARSPDLLDRSIELSVPNATGRQARYFYVENRLPFPHRIDANL